MVKGNVSKFLLSFEGVMCLVPARDLRVKGESITSGENVNFLYLVFLRTNLMQRNKVTWEGIY